MEMEYVKQVLVFRVDDNEAVECSTEDHIWSSGYFVL